MTYIPPGAMTYPVTFVEGGYSLREDDFMIYCDSGSPELILPVAQDYCGRKYFVKTVPGVTVKVTTQEDDLLNGSSDPLQFTEGCYQFIAADWGMWETISYCSV
jgi:hypothetical protein